MFLFVIRYFGFLKFIPGLAQLFDFWLKIWTLVSIPVMLDWIDEIEERVLKWDETTATVHKYGGLQLNYRSQELGHIHSNGLLDMLLSRDIKKQLIECKGKVTDHHSFKNTGWISFYFKTDLDKEYAIELLQMAWKLRSTTGKKINH